MKILSLVLILFGFHFAAVAGPNSKYKCTPHQMLMVQNPEDKTWHLFVCDELGLPRGFAKSELSALYNATKAEKDHLEIWAALLGVKKSEVWKTFNELPNDENQTWWEEENKKPVLENLARLYKKYVNTKELEPNQKIEMREPTEYKEITMYSQMWVAQKCAEQKAEATRDLGSGKVTCYCNKSTYSNFMDFECQNGKVVASRKVSGTPVGRAIPEAPAGR